MLDDGDDPLGLWDDKPPQPPGPEIAFAIAAERALAGWQADLRAMMERVAPEDFKDLKPADARLDANEARTLSDGLATIYKRRRRLPLDQRLELIDRYCRVLRSQLRP